MLWARVVRGISSMENDVTPVAASFWSVSTFPNGRRKPIRCWSGRTSGRSASPVLSLAPTPSTCVMTPAVLNTSARPGTIFAPFDDVVLVPIAGCHRRRPLSTTTSRPALSRLGMTAGTSATRRSPG